MKLFMLVVHCYITTGVFTCSINVCLRWTLKSNEITFTCKINDLHLPVSFYDNNGEEIGYCISPKPKPRCLPIQRHYTNVTVRQNYDNMETILIVKETIDQHLNGNWSCQHGKNSYEANVEIYILMVKDESEKNDEPDSPNDNGTTVPSYWLFVSTGATSLLFIIIVGVFRCIRKKKCECHRRDHSNGQNGEEIRHLCRQTPPEPFVVEVEVEVETECSQMSDRPIKPESQHVACPSNDDVSVIDSRNDTDVSSMFERDISKTHSCHTNPPKDMCVEVEVEVEAKDAQMSERPIKLESQPVAGPSNDDVLVNDSRNDTDVSRMVERDRKEMMIV